MPMGMTYLYALICTWYLVTWYLFMGLSYRRRFPVVYLTFRAMRRPRLVSNQQRGLRFLYVFRFLEYLEFPE